jgi:hypothetical protein
MTPTKYNALCDMLAEYSTLNAELQRVEANVNERQIEAALPLLPDHARTKARLGEIESKLREIAVEFPELFPDDKRTHQTPFGAISFRKSTWLEIINEDEEKAILRVKVACQKELERSQRASEPPRFTEETLLRKREELNLEALEPFEDADLKQFGVERRRQEKFNVKPLEVKADKLAKAERRGEKPELN